MSGVRALERRLSGFKFNPPLNPSSFVERPWNTWTFERTGVTSTGAEAVLITIGDLIAQLRAKCAIAEAGNNILVKVQSAMAWVTAAGLVYPDCQAVFYELSTQSTTQQIRSAQRDKGTLNAPARCGYHYPMADTKEIYGTDEAAVLVFTAVADSPGSIITSRVNILWQSSP
jgi:hypothetical protein